MSFVYFQSNKKFTLESTGVILRESSNETFFWFFSTVRVEENVPCVQLNENT